MGVALGAAGVGLAAAQPLPPPVPSGRQIQAADGDTIVVEGDDRVTVVRRRQARVRVVADETSQFVIVLADWGTRGSTEPDGRVDRTWRFANVDGRWPLESRWEAAATLVTPDIPPMTAAPVLSIDTPAGVVAFIGGLPRATRIDAAAVLRYGSMSGGGRGGTFDEAEREALSPNFMTSFSTMSLGQGSTWSGAALGPSPGPAAEPGTMPMAPAGAFVRDGAMRPIPRVIHRVQPEWPQAARDAGVRGVVILVVDVALDGTVKDARLVRSIPGLDDAAVGAVRQWRFEPAEPGARPDPLAVTVTVQFPAQP